MQKVSIILAIIVVDGVVVAKFVISAASLTWYVGYHVGSEVIYFGGW